MGTISVRYSIYATLLAAGLVVSCPPNVALAKRTKAGGSRATRGGSPNAAAAELAALAKSAYRKKRWDDAIAAFEGAYESDPLPRFLFNLARCHEKKNDPAKAAHYFERYLQAKPEAGDRRKVRALAKMLKMKLRKSHSKLEVDSEPTGALVVVDTDSGRVEGVTPFSEWLRFGEHDLTVSSSGRKRHEEEVVLRPGAPTVVEVTLEPKEPRRRRPKEPPADEEGPETETEADAAEPEPVAAAGARGGASWLVPATLAAAGALLVGGGVAGFLASEQEKERAALIADSRAPDMVGGGAGQTQS